MTPRLLLLLLLAPTATEAAADYSILFSRDDSGLMRRRCMNSQTDRTSTVGCAGRNLLEGKLQSGKAQTDQTRPNITRIECH